jgi:hypothetical protein
LKDYNDLYSATTTTTTHRVVGWIPWPSHELPLVGKVLVKRGMAKSLAPSSVVLQSPRLRVRDVSPYLGRRGFRTNGPGQDRYRGTHLAPNYCLRRPIRWYPATDKFKRNGDVINPAACYPICMLSNLSWSSTTNLTQTKL